jgi:hypothetical protein
MRKRSVYLIAALASGALAAAAVPGLPAVAQFSPPGPVLDVEIDSPATLGARGAVVIVPVEIVCSAEIINSSVSVEVTQRSGSRIANGFGFTDVTCDGTLQVVDVAVSANGAAFKKGVAFVEASAFGCSPTSGCDDASDSEEVTIERA